MRGCDWLPAPGAPKYDPYTGKPAKGSCVERAEPVGFKLRGRPGKGLAVEFDLCEVHKREFAALIVTLGGRMA